MATTTPAQGALSSDFSPPAAADLSSPAESPGRFRVALATSTDGLRFTTVARVVTEQANTPDFVYGDNGRLFLYYTGWRLGTVTNTAAVAVSDNEGASWAFKNLVLIGFTNGTNYGDPDIVRLADSRFRLFLTTSIGPGRLGIVYGDSTDGIRFTFVGTAASIDGDDVIDSTTFRFASTWHMITLHPSSPTLWRFTATDPAAFALQGRASFRNGVFAANGIDLGSTFRVYTFELPDRHIRSSVTSDGVAWTNEEGLRLEFIPSAIDRRYFKDPAVIRLANGTYLMAYVTRADE